ncbi:MAG: hypothetical protein H6748_11765 [Spirochaetaceae bacterium]|nr:hypothetical protein [Myxococcales bacterium]MCB9724714.1 hypothetical protein [Spirochaetaceae bacterium]
MRVGRVEGLVSALACLAAAGLIAAILWAVGQPLFTDDLWWHLALGEAHLREGPWLAADPLLFTAPGPPSPSAWLAELLFAFVERVGTLQGLRVLHVGLVVGVLVLLATTLRRASGSRCFALVATAGFAALAAYRLVQLRPHLASILGVLLLFRCLFASKTPPSPKRMLVAAGIALLWANLHAGFLLAPLLVAVAAVASVAEAMLATGPSRLEAWLRARRLAITASLCGLATLVNPLGLEVYAPYFRAGASTPSLGRVGDEWVPLDPFRWPDGLHPSPFVWVAMWLLFLAWAVVAVRAVMARRRGATAPTDSLVELALGAVAFALAVSAVRFTWLALLPLIPIARAFARLEIAGRARAALVAMLAVPIVMGFLAYGDWRAISGFRQLPLRTYVDPYPAAKYHAHAVWLMRDAGLEGRLFNDYSLGGFLGYWLAPEVKTFVNGSLNVSIEAMDANRPLRDRWGAPPGRSFLDTLDAFGVDLFLGVGPPVAPAPGQPARYTAGHLEGASGWTLAFRDMMTSLWVRDGSLGATNLARLQAHYAAQGVPFDPARGFDPLAVVRAAPDWARAHGVVPVDFPALEQRAATSTDPAASALALDRIASVYSLLGAHEKAIEVDRALLEREPRARLARRRLAWNAMHRRDFETVLALASEVRSGEARGDVLLAGIGRIAAQAGDDEPDRLAARIATFPLLTPADLPRAMARFRLPAARPSRWRVASDEAPQRRSTSENETWIDDFTSARDPAAASHRRPACTYTAYLASCAPHRSIALVPIRPK